MDFTSLIIFSRFVVSPIDDDIVISGTKKDTIENDDDEDLSDLAPDKVYNQVPK